MFVLRQLVCLPRCSGSRGGVRLCAAWPQGQTWVRMVVVGQSFMLHQIRKLVGMAVAVFRGVAAPACVRLALRVRTSQHRYGGLKSAQVWTLPSVAAVYGSAMVLCLALTCAICNMNMRST